MLCRRCGMESSTTDTCEWCKRPMLPTGATITGQPAPGGEAVEGDPAAEAGTVEETKPLVEESAAVEEQPAEAKPVAEESVLRPLGGATAAPGGAVPPPAMPTHGIGDEATETSVDVSQYAEGGDSIFRPIDRPERADVMGGADPLASRRRRAQAETKSEIPENVRLLRSVIAGLIISVFLALVQFIVSRTSEGAAGLPQGLVFASVALIRRLGEPDTLLATLLYGILVGVMMGLGLGAVLTRFRRGPFVGMLVGLIVGYGLMNYPWGLITGAVTGIACGIIATVGLRQVLTV
jgi:hypothetical protein